MTDEEEQQQQQPVLEAWPAEPIMFSSEHLRPLLLQQRQQKALVLDMNGVLIHRPSGQHPTHGTLRPHAHAFVAALAPHFALGLWSSMTAANLAHWARRALPPGVFPAACLSQAHCTLVANGRVCAKTGRLKPLFRKDLARAADALGVCVQQIVLVDDSPEKLSDAHRRLLARVPSFAGRGDDALLRAPDGALCAWLLRLAASPLTAEEFIAAEPLRLTD